jgi:hypothetical protein
MHPKIKCCPTQHGQLLEEQDHQYQAQRSLLYGLQHWAAGVWRHSPLLEDYGILSDGWEPTGCGWFLFESRNLWGLVDQCLISNIFDMYAPCHGIRRPLGDKANTTILDLHHDVGSIILVFYTTTNNGRRNIIPMLKVFLKVSESTTCTESHNFIQPWSYHHQSIQEVGVSPSLMWSLWNDGRYWWNMLWAESLAGGKLENITTWSLPKCWTPACGYHSKPPLTGLLCET